MSLLAKIYDNSPIFFQNIMTSVAGYRNNISRYGKEYYKHREFLKEFDNLSLDEKSHFQEKELIKFIAYTNENSEFYKNNYTNINLDEIQSVKDLEKLPIIEKEDVRKNISDIITIPKSRAVLGHTGGTTGKSLTVYFTSRDMMKRMAMLDHFKSRVGYEHLKMRRATFNGKHIIPLTQKEKIYWRYNASCKQMIYSSFHLTEENLEYYVDSLNKFKPEAIDGFFTSMLDVASYIERHNVKLEFSPVAIFPTSETLTESGRELLERVFNSKVYDQYASSEGAPFVTECINQNLHIEMSTGVFEKLEENDEVIVTSFSTYGTPLIRYRIGDSMIFSEKNEICTCGNNSPMILNIRGRKLDFLYTAKGAKISSGNVANLFKDIPNSIIRAQTVQNKIDEIEILLEVDEQLHKIKFDDQLKKEFEYKFGRETKIIIKHVKEIPREGSGKFRLIKNNVGNR